MIYDLIIVGAGPAGITASVYAARKQLKFLVVTGDIGGQTAYSGDIENYTGYQFITGPDLTAKFEEHLRKYKIDLREGEEVVELSKNNNLILVKTKRGAYQSKTVIIASGKRTRELGVAGEKEFKNKGLTYCATCDGPLFAKKDVAVIGGGNSALDAALQLVNIANRIYIVNIAPTLTGDAIMREKIEADKKVTVFNKSQVTEVTGDKMVKSIKVNADGKENVLAVQGVFVEIGLIPNSEFAKGVNKNENGEIIVNSQNETNLAGVFAAGDVTDVYDKQIIIAAGEGSKATLAAFRYLSQHRL